MTTALQPATILISRIGGDNSPAAYLTSVLICFVALAKGPSPGNLLLANIEGHVSWLHLLRGVRSVVEVAGWSAIFSGMLAEYAPVPSNDVSEDSTPTDTTEGIEDWRSSMVAISRAITGTTEEKLKNAYQHDLEVLESCFERTFGKGQHAACDAVGKLEDVICWIYQLGDDYMEGLCRRELIPMVILGHFCVLLRTVEIRHWFIHEWSSHIIKEILAISQDSCQWLSWPVLYLKLQEQFNSLGGINKMSQVS